MPHFAVCLFFVAVVNHRVTDVSRVATHVIYHLCKGHSVGERGRDLTENANERFDWGLFDGGASQIWVLYLELDPELE